MKISNEKLKEFIYLLQEKTKKEFIKIIPKLETTSLTQSKFGGLPFISIDGEIPKTKDNKQLFLLAQINCEELPENNIYPKKGILQFWIFSNIYSFENFDSKVVYFEDISNGLSEEKIKDLYNPYIEEDIFGPFDNENTEYSLSFEKSTTSIPSYEDNYTSIVMDLWNNFFLENIIDDFYDLDQDIKDVIYKSMPNDEYHQINGYSRFTQGDPRYTEKEKQYNVSLLQIKTERNMDFLGENIVWGDEGLAHFFISEKNLKNKNFNNIMYYWDSY